MIILIIYIHHFFFIFIKIGSQKSIVDCDLCVIIGTSLNVYPANSIPNYLSKGAKLIIIDPEKMNVETLDVEPFFITKKAVEGMSEMFEGLKK